MVTRHPLLRPAIALMAGVVLASWHGVDWRFGFAAAGVLGLAAVWRARERAVLWAGAWLLAGASLLSFRMEVRDARDLRILLGREAELVSVRGVLVGDPERRVLEQDRRTRYRSTARLRVSEISRNENWERAVGDVAVSTTGFLGDEFVDGAAVEVAGVIAPPQGPMAPGLFDFERYLKWQRIFFAVRVDSTNEWTLKGAASGVVGAPIYRRFNEWAQRTLRRGLPDDESTRLLLAMALGWKPGLTNEISQPFMRTGTLHVFAISGMHIAMIAAILIGFQRGTWFPEFFIEWWTRRVPEVGLGLSRAWAGGLAIPAIWFYTATTGWQASAVRSTIMCTVIIVGWIWRRPNNLVNSLSASALIILLWQPEQLFQPGFQLSFLLLAVFGVWPGLAPNNPWPDPTFYLGQRERGRWEAPRKRNGWTWLLAWAFHGMTGRDSFLPDKLRPKWRRKMDWLPIWFLNGFNISLGSLLGSLPVVAVYFNLVSFSSLVANLVIVPASAVALGGSLVSVLFAWLPWVSECANWISWVTMRGMVWFCRWLESYHWTYRYVEAPGALAMGVYFAVVLALIFGWWRRRWVAATVGLLVFGVVANAAWEERTTTRVTMLPGAGVVFVDGPGTRNDFLVDCGRDREAALVVTRFLRSQGVDRLAAIVLTHGDVEHVEGYSRLAAEFDPKLTVTSAARSRSPKYREIVAGLSETPERWRKVTEGDYLAGWTVWHPGHGEDYGKADDESVVLARELEGRRVVLLGELGRRGQRSLAESGRAAKAEVVFAGAPTEGAALGEELRGLMEPRLVVFGGNTPRSSRALRELRVRGVKVWATAEDRAVVLTARRGRVWVEGMRGAAIEF